MVIDCHVHISALTAGHGSMSPRLLKSVPFRFLRWHFGIPGADAATERAIEVLLAGLLEETAELDAAVVLAFDGVYTPDGQLDPSNTHLYVTNDYVIELAQRHPKMLFGASIHPYRKDAAAELERCAKAGAVLVKWLPVTQNIDPSDARCIPFYEALAHYRIPLLCHTGSELTVPVINRGVANPALLLPALQRGVTVIAAHCGTCSPPSRVDYLPTFMHMAQEHENLYGDTAGLSPLRTYAYKPLLANRAVLAKLVHGSDWPVLPLPPLRLGIANGLRLLRDKNWLRRDLRIKRELGFDSEYFHRAGSLLRLR